MNHSQYRFMKGLTFSVIVLCITFGIYDLYVHSYGWAIIQFILAAINIHSYRKN